MYILLLIISLIFIFLLFLHLLHINSRLYRTVESLHKGNDLKPFPFLGNGLVFSTDLYANHSLLERWATKHERMFRIWFGHIPVIFLYEARDIESVLTSTTLLKKTDPYRNLEPWLGTGLLTSPGAKWKSRRKIITPAFHFKILESFVPIFEQNNKILLDKLNGHANGDVINIIPFCNLYALDAISESAMRVCVNAQTDAESKYVRAVKDMCSIVILRFFRPDLAFDFTFNNSSWGALQRESLKVLHGLTRSTIKQRRQEYKEGRVVQQCDNDGEETFSKRKLTFLDLLIESAEKEGLSDEDIREEVDTFMFTGHDTTGSGMSFVLYCLSQNLSIQEKVYAEQLEILGKGEREATFKDLQEMKYLERVIKETLRLYPSVPIVARLMEEDLVLGDGTTLPKGARIHLCPQFIHRDPKHWTDPEVFNPDNFLPEVASQRHPFAYIPFSAGPRNCIGQKYGMLEIKSCVGAVVRHFQLLPCSLEERPKIYSEVVLNSKNGVNLRLKPRSKNNQ